VKLWLAIGLAVCMATVARLWLRPASPLLGVTTAQRSAAATREPAPIAWPKVAHVVIVIEENKTPAQILGNRHAPYINSLSRRGALFTNSHGVTHPSQPNYFALFAGLTDRNGDDCPPAGIPADAPNLASEALATHLTFGGYAESMPSTGFKGCWAGAYGRKHVPWVAFANVPAADSRPLSELRSYDALPTVTMIIPNVDDDMHSGSIAAGDAWLQKNVGPLLDWGESHDLLFVLTWDEGFDLSNHIPTLFYGPMVKPGRYGMPINHYTVLRTIEDVLGLPPSGHAAQQKAITGWWLPR
jgi:hypothetical protein